MVSWECSDGGARAFTGVHPGVRVPGVRVVLAVRQFPDAGSLTNAPRCSVSTPYSPAGQLPPDRKGYDIERAARPGQGCSRLRSSGQTIAPFDFARSAEASAVPAPRSPRSISSAYHARHSGLVRYLGRDFGNEATVGRVSRANPVPSSFEAAAPAQSAEWPGPLSLPAAVAGRFVLTRGVEACGGAKG